MQLPLTYYRGYARERAYGLSEQRLGKWAGDQIKGFIIGLVVGAAVLWVPYRLLAASPTHWWLWTGVAGAAVLRAGAAGDAGLHRAALQQVRPDERQGAGGPGPGGRGAGRRRGRARLRGEKSVDTKKVNAYVTGVGKTKRIVLWDTLLARLTPRQTRFVVGHELGHYVLGHVWLNILISARR